ncbi:MAG: protein translocase subunit SecDF, partial [Bacteroidales bacterium]|nr:protein translocase subunit SecDF [Bacteroidales bacterium]
MQNKGAIKALAIVFGLIFLYQLSFTIVTKSVERKAAKFAQGDEAKENYYLDSISNENVYNLLVKKYTYRDAKEREINLGLDLKGGMNVTLEVSVKDIVNALAGANAKDPTFMKAMELATERQENSEGDFVTLFGQAYEEVDPNAKLASIFLFEFKDKGITVNSTNSEVLKVLKEESDGAIDRSYQILRTRIDRFGVAQPNIQKLEGSGRILVELPGIKDPKRVRKLLQGTAQLEFWETYNFNEVYQYFAEANAKLAEKNQAVEALNEESAPAEAEETVEAEEAAPVENEEVAQAEADSTENNLLEQIAEDKTEETLNDDEALAKYQAQNPLFALLQPSYTQNGPAETARVGIAQVKDTANINRMLAETANLFPRNMKLAWTVKPESYGGETEFLELVALKMSRDNKCALGGEVITDARQDYGQSNQVEVTIQMNSEGAKA